MRQSRFNIARQYGDHQYWVYNTLTTSLIIVDELQYKRLFQENVIKESSQEVIEMLNMGFYISDDFDELEYLEKLRKTVVDSNKKIADIMIAPTMDCNARCYYCFEHGCHHEKMTEDTARAVVSYIKEHWNHELFNVSWFGGEPLLATDIIDYISELLKVEKIQFISKITTNGYELTDDVVRRAIEKWNTTKVQVSIDALFEEYDRIKNYVENKNGSAFDRVIYNVEGALKAGLNVRVRINFNPLEQKKATELMEFLQYKFGRYSGFSSYFAPIDAKSNIVPCIANSFPDLEEHPFLSMIKFSQKYGYYKGNVHGENGNLLYDEKGLLTTLKLYPSPTNCYASCPSVFAIDSKGDLYKCHRVLGKGAEFSSGNVRTGIEKNTIFKFFCNTALVYDECKTCKLLPICQGGCKINAYIYGDEHACTPIKSILPELIEEYIHQLSK